MLNLRKKVWVVVVLTMMLTTMLSGVFAQGDDDLCIRDINGDMIRSGQLYYIVPESEPHKALTYKKSWFWNYVVLSSNEDRSTVQGTPVSFQTESNFGVNGLPIMQDTKVFIKMNNEYINFNGGAFSWAWLDDKEDTVQFVQDSGKNNVSIGTGKINTVYYDRYGRPCDKWQSSYSRSSGTFFEVTQIDGTGRVYYDDKWLATYIHSNPPKFVFVPVN